MESLTKFVSRSITMIGSIGGAACAWMAHAGSSNAWQGLAVVGLGTAVAGGISWFREDRRLKRHYIKRRDQKMIAVAKEKHGRLTDVELVGETRFPLEECRAFLKEMTESGSAELQIGKEGTMVYLFPGFLSEDEKRRARSAADWQPEPRLPRESPPPLTQDSPTTSSTRSLELE